VTQTAKRLANLAADLGLAKEPTEDLPGWPSELPEQIAQEPLRRQLPTAIPWLHATIHGLATPSTIHGLATPKSGGDPRGCLERQEVTQTAKRLANMAADLGLAKEPTEGLPGWPGKLPEQIAKEPLRRQLHATKAGVRLWCIH